MNIFKNVYVKVFLQIFLGLFLGGMIALVYMTTTDSFKEKLAVSLSNQFKKDFNLDLTCHIDDIDLLACAVKISDVHIGTEQDKNDDQWSIIAQKLELKGSWLSLLTKRAFLITTELDHVVMTEFFQDRLEKLPEFFIKSFSKIGSTWFIYESVSIKHGLLYAKKMTDELSLNIPYECKLQSDAESIKIQLYVKDGVVSYDQDMGIEKISAAAVFDVPFENSLNLLQANISGSYSWYKDNLIIPSFCSGSMRLGQASLSITSEDGNLVIDPISIKCHKNACWCDLSIKTGSNIFKYFYESSLSSDITGTITTYLKFNLYDIWSSLQVAVSLDELLYKSQAIFPAGRFVIKEHDKKNALGILQVDGKDILKIKFKDSGKEKKLHVQNYERLFPSFLFGWAIEKNELLFDLVQDAVGNIAGEYTVKLVHAILKNEYAATGKINLKNQELRITGTMDDFSWEIIFDISQGSIKNFQIFEKNKELFHLRSQENSKNYISSKIDFSFIQKIVPEVFKKSFAQDGLFTITGHVTDGILYGNIKTESNHIRLPYIYNVISNMNMSCELNFNQKQFVLKDLAIDLHEGKMFCKNATFWFDQEFNLVFAHAPIIVNKIMMSLYKGVYSLVSGRLFLEKLDVQKNLKLEGQLFLDKTEIHENILSSDFHEMIMEMAQDSSNSTVQPLNLDLDITVSVLNGLQVKSSFMKARAMIDLMIQNNVADPKITGGIQFLNGQLKFPFKPLDIVSGKVILSAEQLLDPVIELVARGKIKKYTVTMEAWGTALEPHVRFYSQPYLSEKQILSLLMLGVEDQTLSLMVPAFLTQKLQEIIFGPALSSSKLQSLFDVILKSMKYVRFLPQFTSQADRGGLRGIFEIDASENLHGRIDTNFSQIEDTKVDIDYDVTDDVKIRLQKDGPNTYGGEVEFNWKFS